MQTIADRVREVIEEAIGRVSSGGKMKFDIRSLYYAVRELYLKRWPGEKFYLCNSFTQDFMRAYEKEQGKIQNMLRGPRGKYNVTDTYGTRYGGDVREGFAIYRGIGNKIIVVEKQGLFDMMIANNFDKRLDCIIMTTQGFTSEAGRDALLEVQSWGIPVCVLHDYDVNGVLIKETLTKPTKRLDSELDVGNLVDVGLNYDVVSELMETRDLTPEPVDLAQQDLSKLEGMLQRGEISQEEYDFLLSGRVELNALTPLELLEWLEKRLEELDLWKTVPEQDELDDKMERKMKSDLEDTEDDLVNDLSDTVERDLGLDKLWDALDTLRRKVREKVAVEVKARLEKVDYPTIDVEEFKEEMREHMEMFWTILAEELAGDLSGDLVDPFRDKVEDEEGDITSYVGEHEEVDQDARSLAEEMRTWIADRGYH